MKQSVELNLPRRARLGYSIESMSRPTTPCCVALLLLACGGGRSPGTAVASDPGSPPPSPPASAPPAVSPQAPEPARPQSNPCTTPAPLTFDLELGVLHKTPWGLDLTYVIDRDPRGLPGYSFRMS